MLSVVNKFCMFPPEYDIYSEKSNETNSFRIFLQMRLNLHAEVGAFAMLI